MAKLVDEIMNREVFALRPDESAQRALGYILALGITGAPVVDSRRRPLGHASLRDLLRAKNGPAVRECMTAPALTVDRGATIGEAGRKMSEGGVHRLVVIDEESSVVGMVSALDVVSASVGMPVLHPASLPHYDRQTGATWSDDAELTLDTVPSAPRGPGVLVLIESVPHKTDRVSWIEGTPNVQARLYDMISSPQEDPLLARLLEHPGKLHYRAAAVGDESERDELIEQVKASVARWHGALFRCETQATVAEPWPHRIE
jgi:hypothetical protein